MNLPQTQKWYGVALASLTLFLFFLSLTWVSAWRLDPQTSTSLLVAHWSLFSAVNLIWLGVFYVFDLFTLSTYRNRSWIRAFVFAAGVSLALAVLVFYVQPELVVTPRRILLFHAFCSFGLFFLSALLVSRIQKYIQPFSILFVGVKSQEVQRFLRIAQQHHLTLRIEELSYDLLSSVSLADYDAVTFAPGQEISLSPEVWQQYAKDGVNLRSYAQLYEDVLRRVPIAHLDAWGYVMPVGITTNLYTFLKRVVDVLAGLVLGFVFIVTAPFIVLLIKLSSRGPVFFTQRRVTLQGKPFTIFKYRTMFFGTPSDTWTRPNDSRITWIGFWLRRTHLDELPQAWNLLKGELSLIGPRPEQEVIVNGLIEQIPFYLERHQIRCGLTGWAQLHVYAGTLEETQEKLEYDLYYLKHRSLLFDLEILLRTIRNFVRFDLHL